jgi:hypothetical protein
LECGVLECTCNLFFPERAWPVSALIEYLIHGPYRCHDIVEHMCASMRPRHAYLGISQNMPREMLNTSPLSTSVPCYVSVVGSYLMVPEDRFCSTLVLLLWFTHRFRMSFTCSSGLYVECNRSCPTTNTHPRATLHGSTRKSAQSSLPGQLQVPNSPKLRSPLQTPFTVLCYTEQ